MWLYENGWLYIGWCLKHSLSENGVAPKVDVHNYQKIKVDNTGLYYRLNNKTFTRMHLSMISLYPQYNPGLISGKKNKYAHLRESPLLLPFIQHLAAAFIPTIFPYDPNVSRPDLLHKDLAQMQPYKDPMNNKCRTPPPPRSSETWPPPTWSLVSRLQVGLFPHAQETARLIRDCSTLLTAPKRGGTTQCRR